MHWHGHEFTLGIIEGILACEGRQKVVPNCFLQRMSVPAMVLARNIHLFIRPLLDAVYAVWGWATAIDIDSRSPGPRPQLGHTL